MFLGGLRTAVKLVERKIKDTNSNLDPINNKTDQAEGKMLSPDLRAQWKVLAASVMKFDVQKDRVKSNFAFDFVEGNHRLICQLTTYRTIGTCSKERILGFVR